MGEEFDECPPCDYCGGQTGYGGWIEENGIEYTDFICLKCGKITRRW
jgi:hypothetical protein